MSTQCPTHNLRVTNEYPLLSPGQLRNEQPLSDNQRHLVLRFRQDIERIMRGDDSRLLLVVGPCSVHNTSHVLGYCERLAELATKHAEQVLIVARLCGEKPRTTIGWKGYLSDPDLDGTNQVEKALPAYRHLVLQCLRLGLPVSCEVLNPLYVPYFADTLVLGWIGARSVEAQPSREMASGLSFPVGAKHTVDGTLQNAVDAIITARHHHSFLGMTEEGRIARIQTTGNQSGFLILRGAKTGTNHDADSVAGASRLLREHSLCSRLMVDCSHGNAPKKDYALQESACREVLDQIREGNQTVMGLMLESYHEPGSQPFPNREQGFRCDPNISVTDPCIGWETTETLIAEAAEAVKSRMQPA